MIDVKSYLAARMMQRLIGGDEVRMPGVSIANNPALDITLLAGARITQSLSNVSKQLSSGLRISAPSDGPAEFTIAENFQTRVLSHDAASENMQLVSNVVNVASGALSGLTSIIQRLRELSIAAASNLISSTARDSLQAEVVALNAEINQITSTTSFNGVPLFRISAGSPPPTTQLLPPSVVQSTSMRADGSFQLPSNVTAGNRLFLFLGEYARKSPSAPPAGWTPVIEDRSGSITDADTGVLVYTKIASAADDTPLPSGGLRYESGFIIEVANADTTNPIEDPQSSFQFGSNQVSHPFQVKRANELALAYFVYKNYPVQTTPGTVSSGAGWNDLGISIVPTVGIGENASALQSNTNPTRGAFLTPSYQFTYDAVEDYGFASSLIVAPLQRPFQEFETLSGPSQGETLSTPLPLLSAYILATAKIDVTSVDKAQNSIGLADDALEFLGKAQNYLGVAGIAAQSRLNTNQIASVDETASLSNIRDANVANDISELTKLQLLQSFTTSLLVQGQNNAKSVLQLIR